MNIKCRDHVTAFLPSLSGMQSARACDIVIFALTLPYFSKLSNKQHYFRKKNTERVILVINQINAPILVL